MLPCCILRCYTCRFIGLVMVRHLVFATRTRAHARALAHAPCIRQAQAPKSNPPHSNHDNQGQRKAFRPDPASLIYSHIPSFIPHSLIDSHILSFTLALVEPRRLGLVTLRHFVFATRARARVRARACACVLRLSSPDARSRIPSLSPAFPYLLPHSFTHSHIPSFIRMR